MGTLKSSQNKKNKKKSKSNPKSCFKINSFRAYNELNINKKILSQDINKRLPQSVKNNGK